jgi:uncharacterized protein (DUF2141 family)
MHWALAWLMAIGLAAAGCAGAAHDTAPPDRPDDGLVAGLTVLVIQAGGFRSDTGVARIAVFGNAEGFPDQHALADQTWVGPIQAGQVQVMMTEPIRGRCAVAVIHDENDNGRLDANLLGIPTEGFGVSNNPEPGLGPPTFEQAQLELKGQSAIVRIGLRYF